jgi:hypothetical protein
MMDCCSFAPPERISDRWIWSSAPIPHRLVWSDFVALMTRCAALPPIADKHSWPLWSPTLYDHGATRAKASVRSVSMLVLDQDSGVGWQEAVDPFHRVQYLVHSSYSHTQEKPKFRIIIPLAAPVAGEDWPLVWSHLTRDAIEPDPACKDASRVYFLPSRPPHAQSFLYANQSAHCSFLAPDVERIKRDAAAAAHKRQPVQVPYGLPERRVQRIEDDRRHLEPDHRLMVANELGARISSGYAERINCPRAAAHAPGKNHDSVWFRLDLGGDRTKRWAKCNHVKTCGWYGRIEELR